MKWRGRRAYEREGPALRSERRRMAWRGKGKTSGQAWREEACLRGRRTVCGFAFLLVHGAGEACEGVKPHETGLECSAHALSGCFVGENCRGQGGRPGGRWGEEATAAVKVKARVEALRQ